MVGGLCVAIISYFSSFLFKQKMMCGFLWEVDIETHLFCSGRRIACDDDLITMIWRMLYVRVCVCVFVQSISVWRHDVLYKQNNSNNKFDLLKRIWYDLWCNAVY